MRLNSLARRYAQAIFNSSLSHNICDNVMNDLAVVEEVSNENLDFLKILNSPIVSKEKKKSIINDVFSQKVDSLTLNFINLLIDKNRETVLPIIKEEFEKLYNETNSLSNLVIESVIYLSDEQKNAIKDKMENKFGKKFFVQNILNENLIGGVRLLFDDNVIDGSIKSKLQQMKEVLAE